MFEGDAASARWTFDDLWQRSNEVARALIASGLGKGEYVGILMTNRLEWVSGCFGIALAGGVAVGLSTFSTADELAELLRMSGLSVLLFERHVAGKDFAAMLAELEPAIGTSEPGKLASARFPFLRRLVMLGDGQTSLPPSPAGRGSGGGGARRSRASTLALTRGLAASLPHPNPSPPGRGLRRERAQSKAGNSSSPTAPPSPPNRSKPAPPPSPLPTRPCCSSPRAAPASRRAC